MACIGCGLAVNGDGTGRVDIDTQGGLTCVGTAGGTANTAGTGLAIKKSAEDGNSLTLSSAGLYVPPVGRFESYNGDVAITTTTGPNNGSSVNSSEAAVEVVNNDDFVKRFFWLTSFVWEGVPGLTPGLEVHINSKVGGGAWFYAAGGGFADGTWISPLNSTIRSFELEPGDSVTVRSRMDLFVGTVVAADVRIRVWGGYQA